jgi:hypothetical protein
MLLPQSSLCDVDSRFLRNGGAPTRLYGVVFQTATILVFIAVKMLTLLYGCEQTETLIYCWCQKHRWQHLLDSATVRHLSTKLWGLQLFNSNPRVSAVQFYVVVKPSFMNQGEITEAGVGRLPESPVACRSKLNCLFRCNSQLRYMHCAKARIRNYVPMHKKIYFNWHQCSSESGIESR